MLEIRLNNIIAQKLTKIIQAFLDNHAFHKGQREPLICGGSKSAGQEIDLLHDDQLTCDDVIYNVTVDGELKTATVYWEQTEFSPPFAQFKLNLSRISDTGNFFRFCKQYLINQN